MNFLLHSLNGMIHFLCLCFFYRIVCGVLAFGAEVICNRVPGLTQKQRDMCRAQPDAMVAIGDGIRLALHECRNQFRNHRWNCTTMNNPTSFGHVVIVGKRFQNVYFEVSCLPH